MDYEKKYNEALERAKYYHDRDNIQFLENIFPELKESEDEKIRQRIIHALHGDVLEMSEIKEAIDWLEKQGTPAKLREEEQNRFAKGVLTSCAMSFVDYLDAHKHEGKMCVSNGECEDIENAFHNAMWDRLHRYYCKYIEKQGEQKSWKPSDEQIGALEHFVRSITESGFASPYDSNTKLVYSLLNDLKKLKL